MQTLMKISLADRVGSAAVDYDDGAKLLKEIGPRIGAGEDVHLDFSKVTIFASPFFNASLAVLASKFDPDSLNRLLVLENLSKEGEIVARRSIVNARLTKDPETSRRLAEALNEQEGD